MVIAVQEATSSSDHVNMQKEWLLFFFLFFHIVIFWTKLRVLLSTGVVLGIETSSLFFPPGTFANMSLDPCLLVRVGIPSSAPSLGPAPFSCVIIPSFSHSSSRGFRCLTGSIPNMCCISRSLRWVLTTVQKIVKTLHVAYNPNSSFSREGWSPQTFPCLEKENICSHRKKEPMPILGCDSESLGLWLQGSMEKEGTWMIQASSGSPRASANHQFYGLSADMKVRFWGEMRNRAKCNCNP